jgi:hypothetical protein
VVSALVSGTLGPDPEPIPVRGVMRTLNENSLPVAIPPLPFVPGATRHERGGSMTPEGMAILDRYRSLRKLADAATAALDLTQARTRDHMEKVNQFEAAARTARAEYQARLKQAGTNDPGTMAAKTALAKAEATLAEGLGILQTLRAEVPKLQGQMPSRGDLEVARKNAWEAIWEDLRSNISPDLQQFVGQSYAALVAYKVDAPYSVALSSLFPTPPTRQECTRLTEELARLYSIPL